MEREKCKYNLIRADANFVPSEKQQMNTAGFLPEKVKIYVENGIKSSDQNIFYLQMVRTKSYNTGKFCGVQ